MKNYNQEYYLKNKDKINEYHKEYRLKKINGVKVKNENI